jgi:hypothetical protein
MPPFMERCARVDFWPDGTYILNMKTFILEA